MPTPTKDSLPEEEVLLAANQMNAFLLSAAETMNNLLAAENRPEQPVQDCISVSLSLKSNLENHYRNMKKRAIRPSQRREFMRNALDENVGSCIWEKKALGTFTADLAKISGVSTGTLKNKVFPDRIRPDLCHVEKLLVCIKRPENEYYRQFGWAPKEENIEIRNAALEKLLEEKWGVTNFCDAAPYLMLSYSTMDNVRRGRFAQLAENADNGKPPHPKVSTAFRFIIALTGTSKEQIMKLYHLFGLEPILPEGPEAWGEADGIVKISADVFDKLHLALRDVYQGAGKEYGSAHFFVLLYLMLKGLDSNYQMNLSGQLFSETNSQLQDSIKIFDEKLFFTG